MVRHGFQQVFKELSRYLSISLVDQLSDREFAGAADADEQVELFNRFRRLQRQRYDPGDQCDLERCDPRRPRLVAQQAIVAVGHEPLLPAPHAGLRLVRRRHDRGRAPNHHCLAG